MKSFRFLILRMLVLVALLVMYLYLGYGQERPRTVPVARHVAWNDLVNQINLAPQYPPRETLGTDFVLIRRFLREHQREVRVRSYDPTILRAIDMARARLERADQDLQIIRDDLSYKEARVAY